MMFLVFHHPVHWHRSCPPILLLYKWHEKATIPLKNYRRRPDALLRAKGKSRGSWKSASLHWEYHREKNRPPTSPCQPAPRPRVIFAPPASYVHRTLAERSWSRLRPTGVDVVPLLALPPSALSIERDPGPILKLSPGRPDRIRHSSFTPPHTYRGREGVVAER